MSEPSVVIVPGWQPADWYVPVRGQVVEQEARTVSIEHPLLVQLLHLRVVYVWPATGGVHTHRSVFMPYDTHSPVVSVVPGGATQ